MQLPHAFRQNLLLSLCRLALIWNSCVLQQLHLMVILICLLPYLETAEALDTRFEPVDWESSPSKGIGSILSSFILIIFTPAHVISESYCMLLYLSRCYLSSIWRHFIYLFLTLKPNPLQHLHGGIVLPFNSLIALYFSVFSNLLGFLFSYARFSEVPSSTCKR